MNLERLDEESIRKFILVVAILLTVYVLVFNGLNIYNNFKNYQSLIQKRESLVQIKPVYEQIKNMQEEYASIVVGLSDKYYTEPKLFSLWQNIGALLPGVKSFVIDTDYKMEDGIVYFYGTLVYPGDPVSSLAKVQNIKPSLIPVDVGYANGATTIRFKAPILSQSKTFRITENLYKQTSYVVARLICYSKDPQLVPQGQNIFVSKQGDYYYAGEVLASGLDIITAQKVAYEYAQKGIITFIGERRVGK
ncbi:MAG: hypothetical protein QXP36_04670 [Conexivisphaerales archaeon]